MKENEWTRSICEKLQLSLQDSCMSVETLRKIPYSQEIQHYSDLWEPHYMIPTEFETDMVVYEKLNSTIKPRVIIEAKLREITTHDAITYSYKAEKHKNITPYLRYGIMLGGREHHPLPGRLYRHGTNFDFMFSFAETKPNKLEWDSFTSMILKEIEYSRQMEEMLHESRQKGRKRYYMLQKQLVLKEIPADE